MDDLQHKRSFLLLIAVILVTLFISACGEEQSVGNGDIPDIDVTNTPIQHATPTPVAVADLGAPADIDWTQTAHYAPAMRDEYVSDIDDWAGGNRYYIEASLEFTETAAVVNGAQRVRYVNTSPNTLDQIVFQTYANLPVYGGRMRVTQATVDGAPATFESAQRNTAVVIDLNEPLEAGESTELVLDFVLVAERGVAGSRFAHFGFQNNILVAPEWYPVISPYDPEDGWFFGRKDNIFGDSVYSETALFEVKLTHPNDLVLAISGVTIDEVENSDGTVTEHVVTGPMRDSMLIASPILGKITQSVDGTDINVYFWPGDERGAEAVMEIGENAIEIFDNLFGDYPYSELDIVETFTISGVEFPGVIIVADTTWENAGSNGMVITVSHEIAHQWWYGVVGNDQIRYGWVDESLTSYSEGFYLRNAYETQEQYTDWVATNRANLNGFRGTPGNIDPPMNLSTSDYSTFNEWGTAHYTKGRVFYDTLEERIGTDAFLEAVRSYYQDMKYKVARPIDILRHFEEASGQDLDDFFFEWIGPFEGYTPGGDVPSAENDNSLSIVG